MKTFGDSNELIVPVRGKRIDDYDKKSEYLVNVAAPTDLAQKLFEYATNYHEAAHIITEFVLNVENCNTRRIDRFFFVIAFLYRHCMELEMKAIGFQYIVSDADRIEFIKTTHHNLWKMLRAIEKASARVRPKNELDWMEKYFQGLSIIDKKSDSFRYPFHIYWDVGECGTKGKFTLQSVFEEQTHIDLPKFANRFEAAYEILGMWYLNEVGSASGWMDLEPIFIEEGGYYCTQSIVGFQFKKWGFYPYTKAYLETANYLKWYVKDNLDLDRNCKNRLFFPMCYLYRNCVELWLKSIWFEETSEEFQDKCKLMSNKKHSIEGMWNKLKPYVLEYEGETSDPEYIDVIEDYCKQIQAIDSDASKFRYPMTKEMQVYFPKDKEYDFVQVGDFMEELINILDCIKTQFSVVNEQKVDMMLDETNHS